MASLSEIYIAEDKLEIMLKAIRQKGQKGIKLTISLNDETNDYGHNVSVFVAQTKEEVAEKKKKYYVGNGKTFWTDGKVTVAKKIDKDLGVKDTNISSMVDDPFDSIGGEELPF